MNDSTLVTRCRRGGRLSRGQVRGGALGAQGRERGLDRDRLQAPHLPRQQSILQRSRRPRRGATRLRPTLDGHGRGCLRSGRVSGWSSPGVRRLRARVSASRVVRLLVLTRGWRRSIAEVACGAEGVGVVLAEGAAAAGQGVGVHRFVRAADAHPSCSGHSRGCLAELRVSGWSSPRVRRRRAKVSAFRFVRALVLTELA